MVNSKDLNQKIVDYWKSTSAIYDGYLEDEGHNNIHYGFSADTNGGVESTEDSTNKMNKRLAEIADIGSDDTVLFCGCGVGGPAIWIAQNRGAEAVGINIVGHQLEQARKNAKDAGVSDQTDFRYDDHTKMQTIDDGEIDVIWAIEAIIYAEEKRDFIEQAQRVLGEDGRFVVAEGFRAKRRYSEEEEKLLRELREGWSVPNLAHINDFVAHMEVEGFIDITVDDITENIEPFSKWQSIGRHIEYAIKLQQLLGLMLEAESKHLINQNVQYRNIQRNLIDYCIISASV